jgi:hypothetical protein
VRAAFRFRSEFPSPGWFTLFLVSLFSATPGLGLQQMGEHMEADGQASVQRQLPSRHVLFILIPSNGRFHHFHVLSVPEYLDCHSFKL